MVIWNRPASKLSYLGEHLLSRASRASTFQDIPQMESLLAGQAKLRLDKSLKLLSNKIAKRGPLRSLSF